MEKFKNGSFAKGSTVLMRRKPTTTTRTSPSPSLPDTPVSSTDINSIKASNHTPLPAMQIHNLLN